MASVEAPPAAWKAFRESADQILASAAPSAERYVALYPATSATWGQKGNFQALAPLCSTGWSESAAAYVLKNAQREMQEVHIKRFWEQLGDGQLPSPQLEERLLQALKMLDAVVEELSRQIDALSQQAMQQLDSLDQPPQLPLLTLTARFKRFVGAALLTDAPISLSDLLRRYYSDRLQEFSKAIRRHDGRRAMSEDDEGDDEEEEEEEEDEEPANPLEGAEPPDVLTIMGQEWCMRLHLVDRNLTSLGAKSVSEEAYTEVLCSHLQQHLQAKTQKVFQRSVLGPSLAYVSSALLQFLRMLAHNTRDQWKARLTYYVYETVGHIRIGDLFDIVVDYPDSMPAVRDLGQCLRHANLQADLIQRFRQATQVRLLHPGAATSDIITQYVHTMKTLREVDPTGMLLEEVSDPIREYLRGRKDTIRCIVTALTDDAGGQVAGESLFDELQRTANDEDDDSDGGEDDAAALKAMESWQPEAVEMDIKRPARAKRMHDIISMLVHVYGTKDLFINEYRAMLADRLLSKTDYNCDREIRTLELLKLRFGENNMHNCEVMLKDLADSKRINTGIQELPDTITSPMRGRRPYAQGGIGPVTASIISALFWPALQEEVLKLPHQMQAYLGAYAAKYDVLKNPRKLVWKPHLGTVTLNLTVKGATREYTVTPYQATILTHFQVAAQWTADDLAAEMGTSVPILRRRIIFWLKQGVLHEAQGASGQLCYARVKTLADGGNAPVAAMEEDGEDSSALVNVETQLQQEMAMYEQYIVGMLVNFSTGLPADRIHNMLKMFVPDQAYDKSAEQLQNFLVQLVADEKLQVMGGIYTKRT